MGGVPNTSYAELILEGLREARVEIVTAVPESHLKSLFQRLPEQEDIRYIPVSNEGEMPGIVAGVYLGGKRAVMICENSGLRQACESLTRLSYVARIPMVLIMSYRGDFGENNWWGHNHAQTMEPILNALRFPYRVIRDPQEIKPSIKKAWLHADSSQWPAVVVLSGDCVEGPADAED